jgi:hypothetical protein
LLWHHGWTNVTGLKVCRHIGVIHRNPLREHNTDQPSIQPASDLSPERRASGTHFFTTPVKRSRPLQRDGNQGRQVVSTSPEGDVTLHPPNVPKTPGSLRRVSSPRTPWSSQRANIGIRRARQNSVLLGSPARPSHSTRMRQVFEEASLEDTLSHRNYGVIPYPQLPNISRPCPPANRIPASRPSSPPFSRQESPILLNQVSESSSAAPSKIELLRAPARSPNLSESWSGDSDYLVTELHPPAPSPPAFSRPIRDWLGSLDDSFSHEASSASNAQEFSDMEALLSSQKKTKSSKLKESSNIPPCPTLLREGDISPQVSSISDPSDPFRPFDDNLNSFLSCSNGPNRPSSPLKDNTNQHKPIPRSSPQEIPRTDDADAELSSLSPNVCIERGPSRYRSVQNSRSPLRA